MKLLILLLLPAFSIAQQPPSLLIKQAGTVEPSKYDTVKCYVVVAEWNKDSTAHLVINKAWAIRRYPFMGYEVSSQLRPVFHKQPYPYKYLHSNKMDTLSVIKDFTPIIQDWK